MDCTHTHTHTEHLSHSISSFCSNCGQLLKTIGHGPIVTPTILCTKLNQNHCRAHRRFDADCTLCCARCTHPCAHRCTPARRAHRAGFTIIGPRKL